VTPPPVPEPVQALTDPRDTVITERLDEASDTTLPQRDM
jgi:hypothetical protein